MSLIDSHCHLEMSHYDEDREAVIDRAIVAGVSKMITVGTNLDEARKAAAIAQSHPQVYFTVGFHPHDAKFLTEESLKEMTEVARSPKIVGWGETGLDYHYDHSPRHIQRNAFAEQIYAARDLDLPLVIHTRDANNDTLGILENESDGDYRGVFHCFGADIQMARRVLDLGFKLGFTGTVTFKKNMMIHDVIKFAGLQNLLVETDSPFLTPVPFRGKRNEPAHVVLVAQALAEILGTAFETVAEATMKNTIDLFTRLVDPV